MKMQGWRDGLGGSWERCRLALLAAALLAGPAVAQTAAPEEYAARSVARVALLDLRCRPNPSPDDYLIADHLLAAASAFQPEDAELVRARIQASWAAGDSERVESLTRRLVVLDPRDTVAQLRLASSRVGRIQTVEDRLAAYDRLLGPAGASIDPSVRSRLALDAALLCRETGDYSGFIGWLTKATQLDSTNKEAAALAWSHFGPMVGSAPERLELLLNLLMSDPTDPNVHRTIATELAYTGAFEQALRFHELAVELYQQIDPGRSQQLLADAALFRWQADGPEVVVSTLNLQLAINRQQAANRIMQYREARMPTDSLPKPEEVMLPPGYNQMRLVAAIMADDKETIAATLADMGQVFTRTAAQAAEADKLSSAEERNRRMAAMWGELTEQLVAIAWADAQTDALQEWADSTNANFGEASPISRMINGWAQLRLGDPAEAERLFRGVGDEGPMNLVGLGLALEKLGRVDEANELYRRLAVEGPMLLTGVWARDRFRKATGVDPLATPERAEMIRLTEGVPPWVDRMARDPRSFMALRVDLLDGAVGATERPGIRVRLTNLSPIPLGVGGDRTLNSRLLLVPRLQIGTAEEFSRALPEVRELDHRLRLNPTEAIDVVLWPDSGLVGWHAEVGSIDTVRERWRVLQGYQLDGTGVPGAGLLCLEAETERLVRMPLALGRASGVELADALDAAGEAELPEVVAAVRARVFAGDAEYALTTPDLQRIASVAADRYPGLPPVSRAMMLAVLPGAKLAPGMEAFDAVALAEQDPLLAPVALVTRVTEADDPALTPWIESQTDGLGSFARALRERLRSPELTFSRLGPAVLRAVGDGAR